MIDQFNDRKLTIPEYVSMEEQYEGESIFVPTIPTNTDETYMQPDEATSEMIFENIPMEATETGPSTSKTRGPYIARYEVFFFAMMCDRFGISDRVASCLASALFKDINLRDDLGRLVIMDKSKVGRERNKCREKILRERVNSSCH